MQSCYLEPSQLGAFIGSREVRKVGLALLDRNALSSAPPPKEIFRNGLSYIGLSSAFLLSPKDETLFGIQLSGLANSVRYHLACCDAAGAEVPYRLISEPGQYALPGRIGLVYEDAITVILRETRKLLPKGFTVEVCQNNWTNTEILEKFIRCCEEVSKVHPVIPGLQVWLSPFGRSNAGTLMGVRRSLLRLFGKFRISEFGLETVRPQFPPSQPVQPDLHEQWMEKMLVRWVLATGREAEEWPLWCPLSKRKNGPYDALSWSGKEAFDAAIGECYARVILAGGPIGRGTDFEDVPRTWPLKKARSEQDVKVPR